MVIVHIIGAMAAGGRERRLSQLSIALSTHSNCRQYIITLLEENVYSEILNTNVKIICIGKNRNKIVSNYFNIIKKIRPDIVHLWTEIPFILVITSLFKYLFKYKLIVGFIADGNPISNIVCKITYHFSFNCSSIPCIQNRRKN